MQPLEALCSEDLTMHFVLLLEDTEAHHSSSSLQPLQSCTTDLIIPIKITTRFTIDSEEDRVKLVVSNLEFPFSETIWFFRRRKDSIRPHFNILIQA